MKAKRSVVIVFAVFLQVILWVNLPVLASTKQSGEAAELESMIRDTVGGLKQLTGVSSKYVLEDSENMKAGTSICDWVAMVLALSGEKEAYDTYVNRLEKYVTESYKADGYLKGGATEYERISLTLLALGRDPLEFGTDENGNSIPFLRDGTYGFREKTLGQQGLSGYIYGLLLLDAMNYEVPKDAAVAREDMLAAILDAQSEEGGFSIDGNGANVDMTAMALQALAPYAGDEKVHASIEKALDWLYEEMTSYGTFVSGNVESCESTAQVILAMCALDVDVRTDTRFEKNGTTLWKGLQAFRLADGTYVHSLEETEGNLIATEQALLALEAVQKRATEGRWIWDFEGYVPPESAQTNGISKSFCLLGIGMLVLLGVGVVAARTAKKRRVNGRKAEGRARDV